MGPACLYQTSPDKLFALVPRVGGVRRCWFKDTTWVPIDNITTGGVPSGVYTNPIAGVTTFHAFVRIGYKIHEWIDQAELWKASNSPLPASLSYITQTPYHRVLPINPISILSQPNNTLSQSHNTEAIGFHACGTGLHDAWMILHWSLLPGTRDWVVSDVVLPRVIGMPM